MNKNGFNMEKKIKLPKIINRVLIIELLIEKKSSSEPFRKKFKFEKISGTIKTNPWILTEAAKATVKLPIIIFSLFGGPLIDKRHKNKHMVEKIIK